MTRQDAALASAIVRWQQRHGRHSLPWQNSRDPYRVWLSEIMLQQTQVSTVLGYYERFLQRFPDVQALAQASQDEVLGLWSGLGYYSRARNLHRCAQVVVNEHGGRFPDSAQGLQTLPGIGRSTAAAIAAFCFAERVAILDGNVKRVLTRVLGFEADLAVVANQNALWDQAQALLPTGNLTSHMPAYTQGLMDLGATVCTRTQPQCDVCPAASQCVAHAQGETQRYPVKTRKLKRSTQTLWMLWVHDGAGAVWLQRRPPTGVWAGLHCLPVFDSEAELHAALAPRYHSRCEPLDVVRHVLTHKDLFLHTVRVRLAQSAKPDAGGQWLAQAIWQRLGLPAPVRTLLNGA